MREDSGVAIDASCAAPLACVGCWHAPTSCVATACRYDTQEAGTLFNTLVENQLVAATSAGFQYVSKHGIDNKTSLLEYIRRCPLGARSIDVKDSYE